MESVRTQIRQLAPLEVPVLITGETGTGKELAARAIHEVGPRAAEPYVTVNCGAITDSLLESELFGHERGAFTGANRRHAGLFEEAGKGTVLLDEIGEVSPRLQVVLLRILETGEIRPVGSAASRKVHCRILAATNAPLDRLESEGKFRKDLLFRLRRMELYLPPLRERREDILPLAGHFLAVGRLDGKQPELSEELAAALLRHPWPGNVRELSSLVERLRLLNSENLSYSLNSPGIEALLAPGAPPPPPSIARSADRTPSSTGKAAETLDRLIAEGGGQLRRLDRLRELFHRYGKLTRSEVATALAVPARTITRDMARLCAEGFIERVMPTASPRTHYFRLRTPPGAASSS
jgi:DNA-binding NtrC family response regulator